VEDFRDRDQRETQGNLAGKGAMPRSELGPSWAALEQPDVSKSEDDGYIEKGKTIMGRQKGEGDYYKQRWVQSNNVSVLTRQSRGCSS